MITIEKNIPLPGIGDLVGMTLAKMEVGDSFLLGKVDTNLRSMLYRKIKQAAPREFLTRAVEGGVRVWRTK
jgi:hypothetical protein